MKTWIKNRRIETESLVDNFRWYNTYGLARSVLALSLLLTLMINDIGRLLIPLGEINDIYQTAPVSKISLFYLLGNHSTIAKLIAIGILFVVVSGWRPRYTGVLHWWITFSFATSSRIVEGGDQISEILTLCLIPITLADHRKNHWMNNVKPNWGKSWFSDFLTLFIIGTFAIIALQISFIYFHASVGKYGSDEWVDGTAIYYWFTNSLFGLSDFWKMILFPILKKPIFITMFTWGTLILEIIMAFGLIVQNDNKRKILLILGLLFHSFIGVFFGLWSFFLAMAGALILYLGPREGFHFKTKKYAWTEKNI